MSARLAARPPSAGGRAAGWLAILLAIAASGCGQPPAAGELSPEQQELMAGFIAKGVCSGLWVGGRTLDDYVARDLPLAAGHATRAALSIDDEGRRVSARLDEATLSAVFHRDHGCTLLPEGADDVFFEPRAIPRATLDPVEPWPLGESPGDVAWPRGLAPEVLSEALDVAFREPEEGGLETRAMVVVHDGQLLAERYAPGFDQGSVMIGWSMGKSLTSALIGTLVERGWLALDQPAPIAEWQGPDDPRQEIRIRDLLRMSSGLRFERLNQPERLFTRGNHHLLVYTDAIDVFRHSTERELEHPPNTVGRYRNCDPLTLGRVLRETVEAHGEDYFSYPQRALFDPLGAGHFVLERDAWGNLVLSGYDHGTARDWARFGLLHLWDGVWRGERILPEGWVDFVSSPAPAWPEGNYGGLFWINGDEALPGVPKDAYYAAGAFGQRTVIVPSHRLVVVRLGYSTNDDEATTTLGRAIAKLVAALDDAAADTATPS